MDISRIDLEPISLDHQAIIDPLWKQLCIDYNLQFSDYSFANVYLFRKKHDYRITACEFPCVRGTFANGHHYYIPSKPPSEVHFKLPEKCMQQKRSFYPIVSNWLEEYRKMGLKISSCRSDSDYLFKAAKLQTFAGRNLSSRRNLIHQLESKYEITTKQINEQNIPFAYELLEEWQKEANFSASDSDYYPCKEALDLLTKLNLLGRIIFANGKPIAFSITEHLTPKTAILHFAKSLKSYKGVTPFLYRDVALHLPKEMEWLNLEQDLGIDALRKAKMAYEPDLLLTKWRAC